MSEKIITIDTIGAGQFNNAEYGNFAQRTAKLIQAATVEKLGIAAADFADFTDNVTLLTDVVAHSRTSDDTVSIADRKKECDNLIIYNFNTVDAALRSPIAAQRAAAFTLANIMKPYRGMHKLAQAQQIQKTRGMLVDLGKDPVAPHIDTIAMGPGIQALRQANNQYAALIDTRATWQKDSRLPSGHTVRVEMEKQYSALITRAFVTSVATPSPEATTFVAEMNKLIADTKAAYKQRIALLRHAAAAGAGAGESPETGSPAAEAAAGNESESSPA